MKQIKTKLMHSLNLLQVKMSKKVLYNRRTFFFKVDLTPVHAAPPPTGFAMVDKSDSDHVKGFTKSNELQEFCIKYVGELEKSRNSIFIEMCTFQ
jgi:hypothetical protein